MSYTDYYEELCPFCENNLLLIYLCEECSAVFCGDCLKEAYTDELICSNCGHTNILKNKSDKFVCKECKSENIISIKKKVQVCPNCGDNHVIKISDKIQKIRDHFKKTVDNTRKFVTPLKNTSDEINRIKEKIALLRKEPVPIYHFPQLELEILQLVKLFDNVKDAVNQKAVDYYDEINRNIKYFYHLNNLQPKVLPIISALAESFEKHLMENEQFVNQSILRLADRISAIQLKLNFMETVHTLFMEYKDLITLEPEEKAVFGLNCKLDEGETKEDIELKSKSGTILLTNRRLYFFYEKGVIKKKTTLLFSVLLDDLQTVQVEGTISKKLSLEFVDSMYKFKLSKENRSQLIDFIEKARLFDNNKTDETNTMALKNIDITVKKFTDSIEEAIMTINAYINGNIRDLDKFFGNIPNRSYSNISLENNDVSAQLNDYNRELIQNSNQYTEYDSLFNRKPNANSQNTHEQNNYSEFPNINRWFAPKEKERNNQNRPLFRYPPINQNQLRNTQTNSQEKALMDTYIKRPTIQHQQFDPGSLYTDRVRYNPNLGSHCCIADPINIFPQPNLEINNSQYLHPNCQLYPPISPSPGFIRYNPIEYPQYPQQVQYPQQEQYPQYPQNQQYPQQGQYPQYPQQTQQQQSIYPFQSIPPSPYFIPQDPSENYTDNNTQNLDYSDNQNNSDINQVGSYVFGKPSLHNTLNRIRQLNSNDKPIKNEDHLNKTLKKNFISNNIRSNQDQNTPNQLSSNKSSQSFKKSMFDGLMSIFPNKDDEKKSQSFSDKLRGAIPPINLGGSGKPGNLAEKLLELEEQEYSINRTLEMLDLRQKRGYISENEYLSKYQKLQGELYNIQKEIAKINQNLKK